jgi:hypothetical protein
MGRQLFPIHMNLYLVADFSQFDIQLVVCSRGYICVCFCLAMKLHQEVGG